MTELISIETGDGRRKKTRVFFRGQEMLARKDLSKENQGKRLAPKPKVTENVKPKPGSQQEKWTFGDENGISGGSYKPRDVVQNDFVEYKESEDQIILSQKNEAKEAKMPGMPVVRRGK